METKTLKSGSVLGLGLAPFSKGKNLFKVMANELKQVEIEISSLDLKEIAGEDINAFKNVIMQLIGSDALETVFWQCAEHCLLNNQKIIPASFEKPEARGDYLPVVWEVIRLNLVPFFAHLDLSSLGGGKTGPSNVPT